MVKIPTGGPDLHLYQTLMNAGRISNTLVTRHLNETKAHSKHSFSYSDKYPALHGFKNVYSSNITRASESGQWTVNPTIDFNR